MSSSGVLQAVKIDYICPPVEEDEDTYDHTTVHDCGCCRLPGTCYYKFDDGDTNQCCHISMCLCKILIPVEIFIKLMLCKCLNSSYVAKRDKQKEIISTFLDYFKGELLNELNRIKDNKFYDDPPKNINVLIDYINQLKRNAIETFTFTKYYKLTDKTKHSKSKKESGALSQKSSTNPCSCFCCEGSDTKGSSQKLSANTKDDSSSHIDIKDSNLEESTYDKCCGVNTCFYKVIHSGTCKNFDNVVTLLDEMDAVTLISEIIDIKITENIDAPLTGFFDKHVRMDSIIYKMYDIINKSTSNTQFNTDFAHVEDIDRVVNVVLEELATYDKGVRDTENYKTITESINKCSRYCTLENADVKIKRYIIDLSHIKKITSLILNFTENRKLNTTRLFQYMCRNNVFEHTHKSILEKLIVIISKTRTKRAIIKDIIQYTKIDQKIMKNRHLCYVVSRVCISAIIILTIIFGLFAVIWSIKQ